MSWFEEIIRSLSATGQLLRHDREGLSGFNNTASGFWRSFSAIILIAPLYVFIASVNWNPDSTGAATAASSNGDGFSPGLSLISLSLQWALWPLAMAFASRWLGLGQHFSRYVIVYNWSNVAIITVLAIPTVLFKAGMFSLEAAMLFTAILQLFSIYFEWYLARLTLATNGLIAAAVVLGNFVLSAGILRITG